ncbi:hypothetical protein KSP40_PGU021151 [Platanthera guangdongensis]|uniref:Uncharacterized protein n=1 Tax=Platanthera guangdongensis TaxID=2320717 RepID=A0ABR2MFU3_9ASPA
MRRNENVLRNPIVRCLSFPPAFYPVISFFSVHNTIAASEKAQRSLLTTFSDLIYPLTLQALPLLAYSSRHSRMPPLPLATPRHSLHASSPVNIAQPPNGLTCSRSRISRSLLGSRLGLHLHNIKDHPTSDLEPPAARPRTSSGTARRMIGHAMGIEPGSSSGAAGSEEFRMQEAARKDRLHQRHDMKDSAWAVTP